MGKDQSCPHRRTGQPRNQCPQLGRRRRPLVGCPDEGVRSRHRDRHSQGRMAIRSLYLQGRSDRGHSVRRRRQTSDQQVPEGIRCACGKRSWTCLRALRRGSAQGRPGEHAHEVDWRLLRNLLVGQSALDGRVQIHPQAPGRQRRQTFHVEGRVVLSHALSRGNEGSHPNPKRIAPCRHPQARRRSPQQQPGGQKGGAREKGKTARRLGIGERERTTGIRDDGCPSPQVLGSG